MSDRTFRCSRCGLILDRDINTAINILNREIKELLTNKNIITPEAVNNSKMLSGGACKNQFSAKVDHCLSGLNRDTMIQEAAPFSTDKPARL